MMRPLSLQTLVPVFDLLSEGLIVSDAAEPGRQLYSNTAMEEILSRDPDRTRIEQELKQMLGEICGDVEQRQGCNTTPADRVRAFHTVRASYRLQGRCLAPTTGEPPLPVAIVVLDCVSDDPLSETVLRRRYRLTEREAQLARLLAEGQTNAEISEAMGISPSTAHHYTERVLLKLGVRNRTEVAVKILRG